MSPSTSTILINHPYQHDDSLLIQSSPQRKRDHHLDLLKWLALLFMVIDHLRYVSPFFAWCYIPGRLAFPFFSLVIAAHVNFLFNQHAKLDQLLRYLLWLLVFALISEWPYELFIPKARSTNVFVTLFLGVFFIVGFLREKITGVLLGATIIGGSFWLQSQVMYGVAGVLLPCAFLLALRYGSLTWCLPTLVCFWANYRYVSVDALVQLKLYPVAALIISLLAAIIGKWVLSMPLPIKIWPVKKWAYAFYPLHLLLLYSARIFLQSID